MRADLNVRIRGVLLEIGTRAPSLIYSFTTTGFPLNTISRELDVPAILYNHVPLGRHKHLGAVGQFILRRRCRSSHEISIRMNSPFL